METLDRNSRLAFEEHYLTCARCASIVETTDEFVRSMRNALRRLRPVDGHARESIRGLRMSRKSAGG
jgi:hypothetical protein